MKRLILLISIILVYPKISFSVEQINLTTPYVADPRSANNFKIEALFLNWNDSLITIRVGNGVLNNVFHYQGEQARNMMIILNKANLTNNSLHKRILNQLINDGYLTGTISGTPD